MARVCHTNNCPVGVASQREELRARFPGVPGDLVNYFQFVAQEVRTPVGDNRFEEALPASFLSRSSVESRPPVHVYDLACASSLHKLCRAPLADPLWQRRMSYKCTTFDSAAVLAPPSPPVVCRRLPMVHQDA